MKDLPGFLKRGEPARLIPVLADTNREQRIASIFLSLLPQIPSLAEEVLSTVGMRVDSAKNRPDGLLIVSTGKNSWSALVEAKIGTAKLEVDQVTRYVEMARANGIDAVITIAVRALPVTASGSNTSSGSTRTWSNRCLPAGKGPGGARRGSERRSKKAPTRYRRDTDAIPTRYRPGFAPLQHVASDQSHIVPPPGPPCWPGEVPGQARDGCSRSSATRPDRCPEGRAGAKPP